MLFGVVCFDGDDGVGIGGVAVGVGAGVLIVVDYTQWTLLMTFMKMDYINYQYLDRHLVIH